MTMKSKIQHGYGWVKQSFELFMHHPAKWLALSSLYIVFFQFLPILLLEVNNTLIQANGSFLTLFIVGSLGLAFSFSWPIFTSFIIGICRETDAGRNTSMSEVFNRIKPHIKQLMFLGVVFFAYRLLMLAITEGDMQALKDWKVEKIDSEVMPIEFWWLILKLLVLQIPLLLSTWYSPLLISYHQYSVWKSIGHSVWASLRNIVSLITAWLTLTFVVVLGMLVLGLTIGFISIASKGFAEVLGATVLVFASLLATALLFSIQYYSFLDMYYKKGEDFTS
ncbi:MAG: hypothetical protein EBV25_03150 [Methylophilaceae bacterium]|jgi:hypothetical protein|nr:hypothetical protein [Methylophilaceae bacterium]